MSEEVLLGSVWPPHRRLPSGYCMLTSNCRIPPPLLPIAEIVRNNAIVHVLLWTSSTYERRSEKSLPRISIPGHVYTLCGDVDGLQKMQNEMYSHLPVGIRFPVVGIASRWLITACPPAAALPLCGLVKAILSSRSGLGERTLSKGSPSSAVRIAVGSTLEIRGSEVAA